uniref:hypothetical protein n=1 Tax=Vibrio sp. TaxID=678 RepID=UPI003D0EE4B9
MKWISFGCNSTYGNLLTQNVTADSKTSTVEHSYNSSTGQKAWTNDPDKGKWYYTFNAWGQLLTQKTARNHTSTLKYDGLGRKVRMDRAGVSTLCWNYDPSGAFGMLGSAVLYGSGGVNCSSPGSATVKESSSYTYNADKQTVSVTKFRGGQSFTTTNGYDSLGRVDTVTYPTGTQNFKTKSYYNSHGYLYKTVNAYNTSEVYTQVVGMNEWGKVS